MKSALKKILCLVWLLVFLQAVLEVNACGIENTFNDEYDTYVAATSVTTQTAGCYVFSCDLEFTPFEFVSWASLLLSKTSFCTGYENDRLIYVNPPPLNILYSIWII